MRIGGICYCDTITRTLGLSGDRASIRQFPVMRPPCRAWRLRGPRTSPQSCQVLRHPFPLCRTGLSMIPARKGAVCSLQPFHDLSSKVLQRKPELAQLGRIALMVVQLRLDKRRHDFDDFDSLGCHTRPHGECQRVHGCFGSAVAG